MHKRCELRDVVSVYARPEFGAVEEEEAPPHAYVCERYELSCIDTWPFVLAVTLEVDFEGPQIDRGYVIQRLAHAEPKYLEKELVWEGIDGG